MYKMLIGKQSNLHNDKLIRFMSTLLIGQVITDINQLHFCHAFEIYTIRDLKVAPDIRIDDFVILFLYI
jgi:hypothetical protein